MPLTPIQHARAIGALLGTAAGDALGAGYEFGAPFEDNLHVSVDMIGGGLGPFDPYEWTDDTSMAIALAEGLIAFRSSLSVVDDRPSMNVPDLILDKVVNRWYEWSSNAKDVGIQTRQVLHTSKLVSSTNGETNRDIKAEDALRVSKRHHEKIRDRSGGNGSLMRTAPLALAFLQEPRTLGDDDEAAIEAALMEAAFRVSALTHWDRNAREACGIWCIAIRHAVLTGELDVRRALRRPSLFTNTYPITGEKVNDIEERVQLWESRIVTAENSRPSAFTRNGWVVEALQGAWSAIYHARVTPYASSQPPSQKPTMNTFRLTLELAVRGGNDTDTVAAIAGGLAGAIHGADTEFIPQDWMENLHGWPHMKVDGLIQLVKGIVGAPGGGTA